MPILSIIIPVYNTEQYISVCIESILNQSFSDFELILVNDGSIDHSGIICDAYALQDNRVRVIHQNNEGVSSARNRGLMSATGKYIAMVDSDDYLEQDIYAQMVDVAENYSLDMIICGIIEETDHSQIVHKYDIPSGHILENDEIVSFIIKSDFNGQNLINSPCNKLYKRSIIIKNNLYFPERKRGEDWLFNINYIQFIDSMFYIDKPLYHYCRNDESTMSHYLPNQFELWLENRKIRKGLLKKYDLKIDIMEYNSIWVEKVLYYLLDIPSNASRTIKKVLKNKEFKEACSSSYKLNNIFLNTIKLINGCGYWILVFPIIWCVNQLKRL